MRDSWKYVTLSDFVDLKHGYQFRDTDFTENGIPIIKIGNVWEKGLNLENVTFISKKRYDIFKSYEIMNGDILMSLTGNIGRVVEVKGLSTVVLQNYRVGNFFSKDENVLGKQFIKWILGSKSLLEQLDRYSNQSAQANFGKQDLDKLKFYLPPLPQQRKIANILSTCDEVIEKTEAAIAKYQALKEGMMHDLFTRGIDIKTGKLRPSYQDAPELYKESELGMIPKEWEVKDLGDVGEVKMCKRIFSYQTKDEGDIPFYKIGTFGKRPDAFISKELYNDFKSKYSFPSKGSVLISASGTIGRLVIYNGAEEYFQDSNIVWIENNNKTISNNFLKEIFPSVKFQTEGGTIKRLYNNILKSGLFPCPPIKTEQPRIVEALNLSNLKLETEQSALAKYQQLKSGLMQDLLTGKVEVSVAEEILKN